MAKEKNKLSEKDKAIALKFMEQCFLDVEFFARNVLGNILQFEVPEFHQEMYKFLPRQKRVLIAAPRGFAKSTVSSVIYPLWLAISQLSHRNIAIISASEGLAVELLRKIKHELEMNENILKYWGDLRTDKWSETHIIVKTLEGKHINIVAKGAGAQIRGFRPDCMILDDIETDEGVESEEQRSKLKTWLFKSALNTLLPHGQLVIVGTILSPLSLLSDLLETDNGWFKRKYMAYKGGSVKQGDELWPSLWPHESLLKRRSEIGSFAFASEFMNSPLESGEMPIKEHQIKKWKELPDNLSYWIALDPAYSEQSTSDYKVAVLVGIDNDNNRYLVDYIRTHSTMLEYMDKVLKLWQMYSGDVIGIGVPCVGTEREFYRSITEHFHRKGFFPPLEELKNTFKDATGASHRKKINRIVAALQPLFENGKYYIGEGHEEAKEELLSIGSSKHDDVVDAMAYVESMVMISLDSGVEKQEKKVKRWFEDEVQQAISDYGY